MTLEVASNEIINRDFLLKGPASAFFVYEGREALLEGGTRTGKSWAFLIKAKYVADTYPNSRQLICRQTRKSMNQSILTDWRNEILWPGHEAVSPTASLEHQDSYKWKNGSEVYFAGLEGMFDTASPILSTKWDRIYVCQAEECSMNDIEILATRLSSFKAKYHQLTYDVNPSSPSHWANMRFSPDHCGEHRRRFPFRHYDNPLFYTGVYPNGEWSKEGSEYISILQSTLTPGSVRYERFLKHKWVAAEGQILENWDPRIHSIRADLESDPQRGWLLHASDNSNPIRVAYFTVGVDWGWHPDPGAMQLWAYDSPRWHPGVRRFRVAEVVKLRWQREEWADLAEDWWRTYGVTWFSCDPSDPENISYFNIRLSKKNYRGAPKIAVKCPPIGGGHRRSKNHTAGIDLMREGLGSAQGHVRTFLLKDAFPEGVDEELRRTGRPTCFEQEVESWTYALDSNGNPTSKPDPKCDQHAIMCFAADTPILTARGRVPIERVTIGDRVLVPYEDEVICLWRSEVEHDLYELETPAGRLQATGSHRFWTTRGWIRLDEIQGEDVLAWMPSDSITTGSRGAAIRPQRRIRLAAILRAASRAVRSFSTAMFGSESGGRGVLGWTSIMPMAIPAITASTTSSSAVRKSIGSIIRYATWRMPGATSGHEILASTTCVPAGPSEDGRAVFPDHELATYVGAATSLGQATPVPACAAIGAVRSSGATLIPTIITASAPRKVGRGIVYNLTVRRTARYIAGGLMASNCAMYDETLNFARGFGKMPVEAQTDWRRMDPAERLMMEMNRETKAAKRAEKARRTPWE
jgi:hypothetical protein